MIDLIRLIEQRRKSGIFWFTSDEDIESIREHTDSMNVPFFRINGSSISNYSEFHIAVKDDLEFFDGYGMNYAALYDCLIDWQLRDWEKRKWDDLSQAVVLYDDFDIFLKADPKVFRIIYSCFEDAVNWIPGPYSIPESYVPFKQYLLFRGEIENVPDYMEFENVVFY